MLSIRKVFYNMKITVAMDSFKGSMTSLEAGNAVKNGILSIHPDAEVDVYSVADGGEGTVETLASAHKNEVKNINVYVTGPLGAKIEAEYAIIDDLAIIEMAAAAGLNLVAEDKRNPLYTTTYGVGEMIRDAILRGCRRFIIGIGGSATNDCGIGMLQALGYRFVDEKGRDVGYGAQGLGKISDIYFEDVMHELSSCEFMVACDVTNPLVGELGCSRVFAPQKGADAESVQLMEGYMNRFADLVEHIAVCDMGDIHNIWLKKCDKSNGVMIDRTYPGSGAAGGLGYAFLMFLNSTLKSGIDIVLDEIKIENNIIDSDYVITGEGKLDLQSIKGKTPIGVAKLAKKYDKKVLVFAGIVEQGAEAFVKEGLIDAYYQIDKKNMSLDEAMIKENAMNNLKETVSSIIFKNNV